MAWRESKIYRDHIQNFDDTNTDFRNFITTFFVTLEYCKGYSPVFRCFNPHPHDIARSAIIIKVKILSFGIGGKLFHGTVVLKKKFGKERQSLWEEKSSAVLL